MIIFRVVADRLHNDRIAGEDLSSRRQRCPRTEKERARKKGGKKRRRPRRKNLLYLARRDLTDRWYLEQVRIGRARTSASPVERTYVRTYVREPMCESTFANFTVACVREQKPRSYAETHCEPANRERNGYLYALLVTATRNLLVIDRVQERVPCTFRQLLRHSEARIPLARILNFKYTFTYIYFIFSSLFVPNRLSVFVSWRSRATRFDSIDKIALPVPRV